MLHRIAKFLVIGAKIDLLKCPRYLGVSFFFSFKESADYDTCRVFLTRVSLCDVSIITCNQMTLATSVHYGPRKQK